MFEDIFNCYYTLYEDILDGFYPAKNGTGFTERNLSVNWVKALGKTRADDRITSWFEYQCGEKNNEHIDALVWDRDKKELFIIEAKRYNNLPSKIRSVEEDVVRIKGLSLYNDILEYERDGKKYVRIPKEGVERCYGIILADVWPEDTGSKEKLLKSYKDETFIKDFTKGLNTLEFNNLTYHTYSFPELSNYSLVSFTWQLK